jgi:hypothetical protein
MATRRPTDERSGDVNFWVLVLFVAPVAIAVAVFRNTARLREVRSATVSISVDAVGAHRTLADGRRESVEWDQVTEVDVFTARVGPHQAAGGAVVLYGDATNGCIVPLDKVAESGLFDHIQRLPGFDFNLFVDALTSQSPEPREVVRPGFKVLLPRPMQVTTEIWKRETPDPEDGAAPDER